MKKTIIILIFSCLFFGNGLAVSGESMAYTQNSQNSDNQKKNNREKVQKIIDEYLVENTYEYRHKKYMAGIKYTEIIEKQLILLVKQDYVENKAFYNKLFLSDKGRYKVDTLQKIIKSIPQGHKKTNIASLLFNKNTVTSHLLGASFGIDYSDSDSRYGLSKTLDNKIQRFKSDNGYYPRLGDVKEMTIYKNGKSVQVLEIIKDFEYTIIPGKILSEDEIQKEILKFKSDLKFASMSSELHSEILKDVKLLTGNITRGKAKLLIKKYKRLNKRHYIKSLRKLKNLIVKIYFKNDTFDLTYKTTSFTLEEAQKELEKGGMEAVQYKDYKKLIGDTKFNDIPEVFKIIPNDSIFFHVNNPEVLFTLLEDDQSYKGTSVAILQKIRDLVVEKAGLKSFDDIKKSITHEFTIVVSDIDLVSPNILIILDKKDKGFLGVVTPGSKPKATITQGNKILIAHSKELLDTYLELDEEDSMYHSYDLRYVWMKKKDLKKDIFFFAGDKFFEKLISLEHYIKMMRKINDYYNLSELQSFVFAFEKMSGEKINDFTKLNYILELDTDTLSQYSVKKSMVKHNKIGKVYDVKNIDEIQYDLDAITLKELASYRQNILQYKEVWRGSLDPLGVIFTGKPTGYEVDFFMTPIPELGNSELSFFRFLFENMGVEKLDFLQNNKLRVGTIGGIFAFDIDQAQKKLSKYGTKIERDERIVLNRGERNMYYLGESIKYFNQKFLGGKSIFDYIDGEIMFSLGGMDSSIFTSYNTEKLDIFLALEFKTHFKAKEFLTIVRKKMIEKFSRGGGFEAQLKSSLMKPVSEIYSTQTIYTIPKVDLYFIKTSFYYTIIDKYFYISVSKESIKETIDFYNKPGDVKKKFRDNALPGKKTLLVYLDSDSLKKQLDTVVDENKLEDLYLQLKTSRNIADMDFLREKIEVFYSQLELHSFLKKEVPVLHEQYGMLKIFNKGAKVYITIEKDKLHITNPKLKEEIMSEFIKLSPEYFTEKGGIIDPIITSKQLHIFFGIATFNMLLEKDYRDSFFKNMTSSVDITDNEIQLKFNSFSDDSISKNITNSIEGTTLDTINKATGNIPIIAKIIISIIGFFILIGGIIFFFRKKNIK